MINLAGWFTLCVKYRAPQTVKVARLGSVYLLTFYDCFGRRRLYEGRHVGYDVSAFTARDGSRFIVQGNWEGVIYCDYAGVWHTVNITKLDDDAATNE